MASILITGGAGFFGSLLKKRLLEEGARVVSIDLQPDDLVHPAFLAVQGDIRDAEQMETLFAKHRFEIVYHCAAMLAHVTKDMKDLWSSNVDGTHIVADCAKKYGARSVVFISSNCLWARNFIVPVHEDEPPEPVELYGKSKWEGEKILASYADYFNAVSLRTPTIMDEGRLGLLTILFDFIREGRKVWVVGGGGNRYQFIYAQDLIDGCLKAAGHGRSRLFNIGSDHVKTFREVYDDVILKAETGARVASLPKTPTLLAMQIAHKLGLSPLGPYQYKMIAENFVFATDRIKVELGWQPTLRNEEMLWRAYTYYADHFDEIQGRQNVSAHKQAAKMGIIRLLKWIS